MFTFTHNAAKFIQISLVILPLVFSFIDQIHFFQLNSYKPKTHFRWLKKNPPKFLVNLGIGALGALCSLISSLAIRSGVWTVLFLVATVVCFPRKGKKPLVFTPRVKRLLTTAIIFSAAVLAVCAVKLENGFSFAPALLFGLAPFVMLIANLINMPMEKGINRHYTNDAKRLLVSAADTMKTIGITGSYGKTSVKYYLTSLLRAKYNTLMTPESYNTPMGVVKTVRGSLRATHEVFVCEMGARWKGDIKELCDIVHPQMGVITSVGPQHLESFGSLDVVKQTKFELADALPADGMLFVNGDDENIASYIGSRTAVRYGMSERCDYRASDVTVSDKGTSFTVTSPEGEKQQFTTRLLGRHVVINVTGAIAVANKMGIPFSKLKGAVRKLEGVEHRLQLTNKNGLTLIDDAYNSNPSGAKAALEVINLFDGFKIIVTPGMVELGEQQEELNREFGKEIAEVCDFAVLVGQKQAVPIKEGLLKAGYSEDKIYVADTIEQALSFVYTLSSDGKKKVVLLENDLPDNY